MAKRIVKRKKSVPTGRKSKSAKSKTKPTQKVAKTKPARKAAKAKPIKKVVKAKKLVPVRAAKKQAKKHAKSNAIPKVAAAKKAPGRIEARHDIGKAMRIAGLGERYDASTMSQIPALWRRFVSEAIGKIADRTDEKVYFGVCTNMDGKGGLDYYAGFEVASFDGLPLGVTRIELDSRRYAVFVHRGPVSKISDTWMAIFNDWMPRTGHKMADAPSFERYHDDTFDAKAGTGEVEIWIPLQA